MTHECAETSGTRPCPEWWSIWLFSAAGGALGGLPCAVYLVRIAPGAVLDRDGMGLLFLFLSDVISYYFGAIIGSLVRLSALRRWSWVGFCGWVPVCIGAFLGTVTALRVMPDGVSVRAETIWLYLVACTCGFVLPWVVMRLMTKKSFGTVPW